MTRWNLILKLIFPPPITTTNPPLWPTTHGDVVPNPHFLFWTRIYDATLSSEKWRKGCGKQCTSRHLHAPGHFIGGPNNLNSKNTLVGLFPLLENWALLIAWAQPLLIRMGNLISPLGLIFYWVPLLMLAIYFPLSSHQFWTVGFHRVLIFLVLASIGFGPCLKSR